MADTIVKSFVIDTTESEQNLKELNTQINATSTAINQGAQSFDNVAVAQEEVVTSSKSLRAQLRDLQQQLAATEPDSAKYVELSQAAGELRDRIGDAAEAVGSQAGGAFERVSGSLGLVTGRLANLDFAGAAEGAKLFATNITSIKFGDITSGIKSLGTTLVSVGKALLTNPIFLIGAALAIAIDYTSQFITGLDGISEVDQKNLEIQKEKAALAKQQLDAIGQQEETLKRQGLTEKQITDLKLQALDTAILEQQVVIETTKTQAAAQIAAAERNFNYLKGFLDFVTLPQKKLTEFFFNFYNGAVDLLNKLGLGIEKVDVGKIVAGFDDVTTFLTKKIFDPEETRKEGEKVIQESEATLRQLTNQRDGILNAQDAKEKSAAQKAADDKAKAAKDAADAQLKAEQEVSDLVNQLYEENVKEFEDAEKEKTAAALKAAQERLAAANSYYEKLAALQDAEFESTLTKSEQEELAVTKKYEDLFAAADTYNATLKAGEESKRIDTVELQKKLAAEILAIQTKNADDQQSTTLQRIDAAIKFAEQSLAAFSALTEAVFANRANKVKKGSAEEEALAKKQFKVNKSLQLAGATIDASKAITASLSAAPVAILGVPNPAGIASLALAVTQGVSQIAKIKATQFQSSSTPPSAPPPSVGGGGGDESQPAQFNPLASQFIQNQPEQITPRAFVLAGDVASQQEVREKVQDLARLG